MPVSRQHAFLAELLKENLSTLLRWAGYDHWADHAESAEVIDPNFADFEPVESRADALVVQRSAPRFFILCEIQRSANAKKKEDWPWYWFQAHRRERCDGIVLILSTDPAVTRWAKRVVARWRRSPVKLIVVDGACVPAHWSEEEVHANLPAAVLALVLRGHTLQDLHLPDLIWNELKQRRKTGGFDLNAFDAYTQIVVDSAPLEWREKTKEVDMTYRTYTEQLRDEAAEQARTETFEQTMRTAIRRVIEKRRQRLTQESAQRLERCSDHAQLDRWFDWVIDQTSDVLELP